MEPLWQMPTDEPEAGDADDAALQAALGRVICMWGEIEASLCTIYCFIAGKPFDRPTILEFGAGRIFKDRADLLEQRAANHFIGRPDQSHEAAFTEMLQRVREYADLRNHVAHTIMRVFNWIVPTSGGWVDAPGMVLIPMYFDPRRFTNDRPDFILNSRRLDDLTAAMRRLLTDIIAYRTTYWTPAGSWITAR